MERHVCALNGNCSNPPYIHFCDITIREGEDVPGVAFSVEEKLRLAKAIDELGVYLIQVCFYDFSDELTQLCKAFQKTELKAKKEICFTGTDDSWKQYVDAIHSFDPDIIHATMPFTRYLSDNAAEDAEQALMQRIADIVERVHRHGKLASISVTDGTRCDERVMLRMVEAAGKAGAVRMKIPDSVGVASPDGYARLLEKAVAVAKQYSMDVCCHTHNDFGLAGANALAAIQAGAREVECTINGLGARAGNATLDEVVAALEVLYGVNTGIDLKKLRPVSQLVEEISGLRLSLTKPIVGRYPFTYETPGHMVAQLKNPFAFIGFKPEEFGLKAEYIFGKLTRESCLDAVAEKCGRPIKKALYPEILSELFRFAEGHKGEIIFEDDFWKLVESIENRTH